MISNFYFENNGHIRLQLNNGQIKWLRQTPDFGQVIWRYKIDTLTDVKHPGIIIGEDIMSKQKIVIHNHYVFKGAGILVIVCRKQKRSDATKARNT